MPMLKGPWHWVNSLALSAENVLRTGTFDHSRKCYSTPEEMKLAALERYNKMKDNTPQRLVSGSDDFTISNAPSAIFYHGAAACKGISSVESLTPEQRLHVWRQQQSLRRLPCDLLAGDCRSISRTFHKRVKRMLKLRVPGPPLPSPPGFCDDDEKDVEAEIARQAYKNKVLKVVEEQHKKALEEDPSVLDYEAENSPATYERPPREEVQIHRGTIGKSKRRK
ncbi:hypothetical protein H6P81_014587 [Aristolochia fimbriata]|uniref:Uncharacterized protein n=1 Tax=Aristolochia fimbriata TaxID=158543 RepID=A0AAV7E710_ARIFI|nr:hypothetical protein H6P81_014587 [Aristolochia fimbriata]